MICTLVLLAMGLSPADRSAPRPSGAPELQLVEEPGVVLGDDRKLLFALYQDGTVIHAVRPDEWTRASNGVREAKYHVTKLSPAAKQQLLARLRPGELHELKRRTYEGCRSRMRRAGRGGTIYGCPTDQPLYTFVVRDARSTTSVRLYDGLSPGFHSNRVAAPKVLIRLWDALTTFAAEGQPWQPDEILVTFRNHTSEIPEERRRTLLCRWPDDFAEFPSREELEAARVLRVVPASRRPAVHDWIARCSAFARNQDRLVLVRVYDLLPGEPPDSVPLKEAGER